MPRVPDVTSEAPLRRMSVARGRIEGVAGVTPEQVAAAKAAALLAAKDASRLLPTAVPFQLTDAFCDLALAAAVAPGARTSPPARGPGQASASPAQPAAPSAASSEAWECTMTVQGYARLPLSTAAMAGVCAALLALAEGSGSRAVLREVAIVQDVVA